MYRDPGHMLYTGSPADGPGRSSGDAMLRSLIPGWRMAVAAAPAAPSGPVTTTFLRPSRREQVLTTQQDEQQVGGEHGGQAAAFSEQAGPSYGDIFGTSRAETAPKALPQAAAPAAPPGREITAPDY